jgi:hypothetical protein
MTAETSSAPRVVMQSRPAGDNTDTSTARTVAMMCDYINQAYTDPVVRQAAAYCFDHFACGRTDPGMLAWAVFWYVKHCVRLRTDEATMFRIGARDEFDLLIAPSVLVRMKDPAEDCDGFTMLCAALCSILGLPVFIATAAVSPDDPSRWSHVFPCAMVNGSVLPLDASHGPGPGWMVPRSRIYRFQAWGLDGRPIDVGIAKFQGLHGYVRMRGMGACDYEGDPTCYSSPVDITTDPISTTGNPCGAGFLVDGVCQMSPGSLTTGGGGSSFDLSNFFNSLFGNAAKVAAVATAPVPTYRLPNGTIVTGVPPSQAASLLGTSSLLPIGLGLAALLVVGMMGSKK